MLCRTLAIAAVLAATAAAAPSTSVTLITHEDASQAQYGQSLPSCVEYSNENTQRNRLGDTNDTTTVTNNCSYEVGVQAKRKLFFNDNCQHLPPGATTVFTDSGHGFGGVQSC